MAEEINIKVKTLDSSVHELTVAKNIPVPDLKAKIAEKTNVPVGMQRIIFKGKVLRDENDLSAYAVLDGHTIHMVERPAQTDAPQQQTQAQTQQQQQQQTQPQGIPGANVMVGTIQLGEGENIGQIVNNVLQGIQGMGIPAQVNVNAAPGGQPNALPVTAEYDHIRQLLNNVTTALTPAIDLGPQPTLPAAPTPPANSVEHLGQLLAQLNEQLRVIQPAVDRLSQLLRAESALSDATDRAQAQQIASRIHTPLQQLGLVQNLLAGRLATVRVNDTPGSARIQAQTGIITPNGNIAFHIHGNGPRPGQPPGVPVFRQPGAHIQGPHFIINQTTTQHTTTTAPQQQNTPQHTQNPHPHPHLHPHAHAQAHAQAHAHAHAHAHSHSHAHQHHSHAQPHVRVFAHPPSQQGQPNAQPNAQQPNAQPVPGSPFNFANIFEGMARAAGTQPGAQPQQANQQGANAAQPMFNNILNQVLNSLQPQQAPAQGGQPQQGQQQAPQMSNFGNIMTQMLAGITQMSPIQQQQAASQQPGAQPAQPTPQTTPQAGAQPQPNAQPALTQMFNLVASTLANPASAGNNSVGAMLRNINDDSEEPLSPEMAPLADVIQVFFDSITMPELLGIMQGQWGAIDRAHAPVATYIRETTLQGDASPERIRGFANDVTNALRGSIGETILPPALISHVIPGRDLLAALSGVFERNVVIIFELVLTQFAPEDPNPFSARVVSWVSTFVRELVDGIAECMTGGVADAQAVVHRFLEQRLAFMGGVAGTAATMITEYIMRTYYNSIAHNPPQTQTQSQQSPQHTSSTVTTTTPNSTTTTTTITFNSAPITTTSFHTNVNPASPPTPTPASASSPTPTPAAPRPATTPTPTPVTTLVRNTQAPAKPAATNPPLTPAPTASTPKPLPTLAKLPPSTTSVSSPNAYPPTKVPSNATDSTIPEDWQKTMKEDEQKQAGTKQNPFSDAYGSGSASKRRKAQMELEKSATGPESLFNSRLEEALAMSSKNKSNNISQEADNLAEQAGAPLRDLYVKLLAQQIGARAQSDPDFDPSRFPLTASTFTPSSSSSSTTTTTTTTSEEEEEEERKIQEALNMS